MTCSGTPSAQACYSTQVLEDRGARGGPEMQIVGALDVHRRQITTKTLDLESGEVRRGRISPAAREPLREWLERFAGREAHFALEGTTGWRFVVEEIERAGLVAHLADPAETAAKRGRKRRAKTDKADCDLMLDLLDGELAPLDRELSAFARRQPGCRALIARLFGVGPVTSTAILAELGDCRRFASSDDSVRHSGLDVTVYSSDRRRAPGHLSH